jgi:hypothetical protein
VIRGLILGAALLALPFSAAAASLAELSPAEVAALIDATSFPNSIGPRREDGLKTYADYGFTTVEVVDKTAELYQDDRSWMVAVTVLRTEGEHAVLCILDRALGGPTYHTQDAKVFELRDDGLLAATGEELTDPACPHMGE